MSPRTSTDPLRALASPTLTLDELREAHPKAWEEVSAAVLAALAKATPQAATELMQRVRGEADAWGQRVRASQGNPKVFEAAFPHLLRARMTLLALERCLHAAAAQQPGGTLRFSFLNGTIVQRLLFRSGLERKPASLRSFRFWWRFVSQKRILMPLVQERGIYCFYTQELIAALKELCAGRPCLEIAAGDGTLSRFLRQVGVEATATDNRAWTRAISYPEDVQNLDARGALQRHSPSVVLCSWPPPDNSFEKHVLSTRSVQLYVVVGSRHRFASGDWEAYERQRDFDWAIDPRLSELVLPPELDNAVLVFRRRER